MGTISKPEKRVGYFLRSSQLRNAAVYILITFAAMLLLNLYTRLTLRDLTFSTQKSAMNDKAQLIVSAFSNYEQLDEETVMEVIRSVNDLHTSRVLITDPAGLCLYDSQKVGSLVGKFTLFPELAEALSGSDVIHIRYENDVFISRAAMPIMGYNRLIGAVYLLENDREQAMFLQRMQRNVFWITVGLEAAIILFSLLFAMLSARRMRKIFLSIRNMHDGDYSVRLPERGHDEISRLGSAFNELSERLCQSEEVRKQFVSNASHELKTPLASIKLLADSILQNDMDPATTREFVSDIGSEADRLTRLSAKLLELTKLDNHAAEEKTPVRVEEVADRAMRMLTPLARKQNIRLALSCEPDCVIFATEDDLYQVLFNLVENGIKYNRPEGSVSLDARLQDGSAVIRVEDTGVGIADADKEHIFERFYRVDKARSRKAGGAGLGLSIVHDMVIRNGGTVCVEDGKQEGTRFELRFPLYRETKEDAT